MRRFISAILMAVILTSSVALSAQQRDAVQRSRDFWFAHASRLPIGSTVRVWTSDGKRQTGVLATVDGEGLTLRPKTIGVPPTRVPFDHLRQLELKEKVNLKNVAIGVAVVFGALLGLFLAGYAAT